MQLKSYSQPSGKIVTKNGKTFLYGDDGYIYEYVIEHNGLGEVNGFFKKLRKRFKKLVKRATKIVGKAVKVVSPVAKFIPALAPFAIPLTIASSAQFLAERRNAARHTASQVNKVNIINAQIEAQNAAQIQAQQAAQIQAQQAAIINQTSQAPVIPLNASVNKVNTVKKETFNVKNTFDNKPLIIGAGLLAILLISKRGK